MTIIRPNHNISEYTCLSLLFNSGNRQPEESEIESQAVGEGRPTCRIMPKHWIVLCYFAYDVLNSTFQSISLCFSIDLCKTAKICSRNSSNEMNGLMYHSICFYSKRKIATVWNLKFIPNVGIHLRRPTFLDHSAFCEIKME